MSDPTDRFERILKLLLLNLANTNGHVPIEVMLVLPRSYAGKVPTEIIFPEPRSGNFIPGRVIVEFA